MAYRARFDESLELILGDELSPPDDCRGEAVLCLVEEIADMVCTTAELLRCFLDRQKAGQGH